MFSLVGFALQVVGEIVIAYTVLRVHSRMLHDHKMDKAVFQELKNEQRFGLVGVILLTVGAIIQMTFWGR